MGDVTKPSCTRCGSIDIYPLDETYMRCRGCGCMFHDANAVPMVLGYLPDEPPPEGSQLFIENESFETSTKGWAK